MHAHLIVTHSPRNQIEPVIGGVDLRGTAQAQRVKVRCRLGRAAAEHGAAAGRQQQHVGTRRRKHLEAAALQNKMREHVRRADNTTCAGMKNGYHGVFVAKQNA